jgi:hypothetical protein
MRKFFSLYLVAVMMLTVSSFSFTEQHGQSRQEADVTRKMAPPYYTGVLQLEPREVGEEIKMCPVLKVNGKTYRLRTYTESSCKEAIDNCKPGDRCVVRGEVGSEGDLFAEEFTSFSKGEKAPAVKAERLTRKTASGSEFKRASEEDLNAAGIKDSKKFGEAWEDPSDMIWSDTAKKEDGSPLFMNHKDAEAYCKSLGAELPSGWPEDLNGKHGFPNKDSDFVRLRKYMAAEYAAGYDTPKGYAGQILPNLTTINEQGEILSRWHWSSSVHTDSNYAYVFDGRFGDVGYSNRSDDDHSVDIDYSVRCVVRAALL